MLRRLSCLFAACAVLIFVSAPALAVGMEMGGIPVIGEVQLDVVEFADFACKGATWFYNAISHGLGSDTCAYAPTLGGRHKFSPVRTLVNGQIGLYYQCEYCGRNYGDALDEAYQEYVQELPGTTYNSSGKFLWVPGSADFVNGVSVTIRYWGSGSLVLELPTASGIVTGAGNSSLAAYVGDYLLCSKGNLSMSWSGESEGAFSDWRSVRVPVSGVYSCLDGIFDSNSAGACVVNAAYSAGSVISLGAGVKFFTYSFRNSSSVCCPWPKFWVTPYTGGSGSNTYELTTRVSGSASDGGLFGYVQDGQLYQSSVGTIYNETTSIYSNPVTGDTSTISAWSYDYSDRSYKLTTNEGDSISVTYGDSSVVINEGGTTYNVLYLVEEPEDVQEDTSHTHSFSGTITTSPTCTGTGVRTLTCTECGWQTTEVVPAVGHSYSSSVVTREPTCTALGVRTGTCTICGDEATEPIPALGHDYSSAVTLAPSCVASGVRTFTCSRCGDAYTESVSATGHVWQSVLSVPTQYDDVTGELVQAGFTLYRCSNCGEEYRIDAASGGSSLPSASGGGASTDGGGAAALDPDIGEGFLPMIAQGIGQDLPEVLETSSGWFALFPGYYSGWAEFLRDGIACLPSEAQAMISFGFGVIAFLGVLLRFAGRR